MFANSQNDAVIDGPYKAYHENGKLKVEGQYKNKKRVGEWKSYYESGELYAIYSYNKGNRNKESKSFYKNGALKRETKKVNNTYVTKEFFENGNLLLERILPNGYYKEYYSSGILKVESNYLNYELSGIWKRFYNSGELEWEVMYKEGYKEGFYKQFYKNGNIKLKGINKKNKKEGIEKRFTEDGLLEWEGTYKNGVFSKTWNYFDASGNKVESIKFKRGKSVNSNTNKNLTATQIPEGNLQIVPIYTGCENELNNTRRQKCMGNRLSQFVRENFNLTTAVKSGLKGKQEILITFKINKQGKIVDINPKANHPALKFEALRVISLLPQIKPGIQRGKLVDVPYTLPIVFRIEEDKK